MLLHEPNIFIYICKGSTAVSMVFVNIVWLEVDQNVQRIRKAAAVGAISRLPYSIRTSNTLRRL